MKKKSKVRKKNYKKIQKNKAKRINTNRIIKVRKEKHLKNSQLAMMNHQVKIILFNQNKIPKRKSQIKNSNKSKIKYHKIMFKNKILRVTKFLKKYPNPINHLTMKIQQRMIILKVSKQFFRLQIKNMDRTSES